MFKYPAPSDKADISKSPKAGAANDLDVANHIIERSEKGQNYSPYTQIGSRILISVNPNEDLEINNNENANVYLKEYRNTGKHIKASDPHIFKIATSSFLHMQQTDISQSIVFMGESGSGKSFQKNLALEMISMIKNTKKSNEVYTKIKAAESVIKAFTNASVVNNNATRAFVYQELHFNEDSELLGCNYSSICLEADRVTKSIKNERNFNILHYLANGASEIREELGIGIGGGVTFEYLKKSEMETIFGFPDHPALFNELVMQMKVVGIGNKIRKSVFKVLAGILSLGNVHFKKDQYSYNSSVQAVGLDVVMKNLGVDNQPFQDLLTTKTQLMGRQRVEVILSIEQAVERKNEISRLLYKQLVMWLIETINQNLSTDTAEVNSFIGLIDIPGFVNSKRAGYYQLCFNFVNERVRYFMMHQVFSVGNQEYASEGLKNVPVLKYADRSECMDLFINSQSGLFSVMERQYQTMQTPNSKSGEFSCHKDMKEAASELVQVFSKGSSGNSSFIMSSSKNELNQFGIHHYWGTVTYTSDSFVVGNLESASEEIANVFLGDRYNRGSKNNFVAGLFSNPDDSATLEPVQKNKSKSNKTLSASDSNISKLHTKVTGLITKMDGTLPWFVLCMNPNERGRPGVTDSKLIKEQVRLFDLGEVVRRKRVEYVASIKQEDFCSRYEEVISTAYKGAITNDKAKNKCEKLKTHYKLSDSDFSVGKTKVFFGYNCWRMLEDTIRTVEADADEYCSKIFDADTKALENEDNFDSKSSLDSTDLNNPYYEKDENRKQSDEKEYDQTDKNSNGVSNTRVVWLKIVNSFTFLIPGFLISKMTGLKRNDQIVAWREKLTLCMLILYSCLFVVFWIGILGLLICPKQFIYSIPELRGFSTIKEPKIAIRGEVFDLKDFNHQGISFKYLADRNYFGRDLSNLFPLQLSYVCPGLGIDPRLSLQEKPILYSDTYYHDHRWYKHQRDDEAFNYYQYHLMRILRSSRASGSIAHDPKDILKEATSGDKNVQGKTIYKSIIRGEVFDMTTYVNSRGAPFVISPEGVSNDTVTIEKSDFIPTDIFLMFQSNPGKDVTQLWERYEKISPQNAKTLYHCLRGAFYIGKVDLRKSLRCYIANYMLLAGSVFIVSIIFFKFIASIRLGMSKEPDTPSMYVVCNVPCYTEGEESLRETIDSIARLKYDDKNKLLFIVCDGMIMGSGNDRPTPRIVLDILGVDPNEDSEALSYVALGEGMKQHNMAKVYSGLYEVAGHVVPYIVIAKCGTPIERSRPGNRGKRDSQILLMRFFNKVQFNTPMTPLELEIFHQIKNVIGVNPNFYEFVLMVDADTFVYPDSLSRLVSGMQNDAKIMGICGETRLSNSKGSWTTMMQVYEYFIAHYLNKAFESLFGSVTCLPGCFCMYRIRSPDGIPLLISNDVIGDYSENNVDTLHKKNLLHLGEDRYLTTLMLKHFSNYKTKFISDAKCDTNAPESWRVLLSQRRRWINSTVHNLFELTFLPNMCGFCCFSMRFIVFIDLISTIIMPATVAYLAILTYQLINADSNTSYISLYLLAAIYGMQAMVFIIHRQWQHIGWMIIYLLAIPLFSFIIPVYSFWHFDDFSWGNTRVVVGDSGKKLIVNASDVEKFDPATIPMRKWSDYEKDLMSEIGSNDHNDDIGSQYGGTQIRAGSAVGNIPRSLSRLLNYNYDSQAESVCNSEIGKSKGGLVNFGSRLSMRMDMDTLGAQRNSSIVNRYDSTLRGSMFIDPQRPGTAMSGMEYSNPQFISHPHNLSQEAMILQQQRLQQQAMVNQSLVFQQSNQPPQMMGPYGTVDPAMLAMQQQMQMRASYYQLDQNKPEIYNNNIDYNNTNMQMGIASAALAPAQGNMINNFSFSANIPPQNTNPRVPNEILEQNDTFNSQNLQPQNINIAPQTLPQNNTAQISLQENFAQNNKVNWPSGIQDSTVQVAISQLLNQADLNSVTKKEVRNQVAHMLGISAEELGQRKKNIDSMIFQQLSQFDKK
ncbi:hypothetical protein BB561_003778 [Smittium simulii]|uniref:chitin synthase n=1 Tax=Smittium simulii TaxID=133385 RepID=A0A2T9YJR1_9FUNG|nr:hypothetical protein BB561_003778 [Smittium simulii]